jgi:hypothetical protein
MNRAGFRISGREEDPLWNCGTVQGLGSMKGEEITLQAMWHLNGNQRQGGEVCA